jgi:hypothetical protein
MKFGGRVQRMKTWRTNELIREITVQVKDLRIRAERAEDG